MAPSQLLSVLIAWSPPDEVASSEAFRAERPQALAKHGWQFLLAVGRKCPLGRSPPLL